jgi:hypothetical protein
MSKKLSTLAAASLGIPDANTRIYGISDYGTTPSSKAFNWPSTSIRVEDYGAVGDGVADDTVAIQAAVDIAKTAVNVLSYSQTRPGRIHVVFDPSKTYKITSAIDLCNIEGFTLDGGAAGRGAMIYGACTGSMLEIIGSGEGVIQNLEFVGDITTKPACAVWISRSGITHGTLSSNINFYNCSFNGYYTKCGVYSLDSEDNHFYNCKWYLKGGGATGCATIARTNIYSLVPEHTTLLDAGYGAYNVSFENCHLFAEGGDPCRSVVAFESGFTAKQTYFYTAGVPAIEVTTYGNCTIAIYDCLIEGNITKSIQVNKGTLGDFQLKIINFTWGTPTSGYLIYANDDTAVSDSFILSSPPGGDSTSRNCRFWGASNVDFSGLSNASINSANDIYIASYATGCKFKLVMNETLTIAPGAPGGGLLASTVERCDATFTHSVSIDNSVAATTLGNVSRKVPIYDKDGSLLGYIPIYDAIT